MPNGGSDCCGTCWFNEQNKGEAGYNHAYVGSINCTIRNLVIENPFWTYCTNHPWHRPNRDPIPIGPVFIGSDSYGRKQWQPSPDTDEIRIHLLELARAIAEQPQEEYPSPPRFYADEMVVWQLGEFREVRAADDLGRIVNFSTVLSVGHFNRTRESLVAIAKQALEKLGENVS